jgi:hypothetical protein
MNLKRADFGLILFDWLQLKDDTKNEVLQKISFFIRNT